MKQLMAIVAVLLLVTACSVGSATNAAPQGASEPAAVPVQVGDPMPGHVQDVDPLIGVPITGAQNDASGTQTRWETTVLSTEWITADKVHGTSGTWIGTADVYLAVDVEYRALTGTLIYSTIDWTFEAATGEYGILGEAGPGSTEEGKGLQIAGELPAGATTTGRVYFGLPAPTAGTLTYETLAQGILGEWQIPTR